MNMRKSLSPHSEGYWSAWEVTRMGFGTGNKTEILSLEAGCWLGIESSEQEGSPFFRACVRVRMMKGVWTLCVRSEL